MYKFTSVTFNQKQMLPTAAVATTTGHYGTSTCFRWFQNSILSILWFSVNMWQ